MSREHIETITNGLAAYNSGDREQFLDRFHPDLEWRDLDHAPDLPEHFAGLDGLRALMAQWDAAFDNFRGEYEECVDAGDSVVCVTIWRGEGKGSGLTMELRRGEVYDFENGLIVRVTVYADPAAAFAAAGLPAD